MARQARQRPESNASKMPGSSRAAPSSIATDPIPARPGLSVPDAPGRNHCLQCGDCVRACEWIVGQRTGATAPLTLGYHQPSAHQPPGDQQGMSAGSRGVAGDRTEINLQGKPRKQSHENAATAAMSASSRMAWGILVFRELFNNVFIVFNLFVSLCV